MDRKTKNPSPLRRSLAFRPWVFFLIFLLANALLAYAPISLVTKLWVGILGLALPFLVGLRLAVENRRADPELLTREFLRIPKWFWVLFLSLLLFTRFYHLTTLPIWPLGDEGIAGLLGLDQSQNWQWRVLWQDGVEPSLIYGLGLYFKLVAPSFFTWRLFPALLSILTCLAAYAAARRFLSRSASFLFLWLFAFSFFEFVMARDCLLPIMIPFFQFVCWFFLGSMLDPTASKIPPRLSLGALSVFSALGFYTWMSWTGWR